MSLTFSLLKPPLTPSKHTVTSTTFLHGTSTTFLHGTSTSTSTSKFSLLPSFSSLSLSTPPPSPSSISATPFPVIKAMRTMQGRVVCATNNKTVNVEVVRLAPHPKYKRRIRMKKKYQAHDPDNRFKVGDWVQLERCRPISKTKTFIAVAAENRNASKSAEPVSADLGIPLESQQQQPQPQQVVPEQAQTV